MDRKSWSGALERLIATAIFVASFIAAVLLWFAYGEALHDFIWGRSGFPVLGPLVGVLLCLPLIALVVSYVRSRERENRRLAAEWHMLRLIGLVLGFCFFLALAIWGMFA